MGEGQGLELPFTFVLAFRFTLAALLVLAWRPQAARWRGRGREWAVALWLGLLLGASYVTQIIGVETIAATRSHFITNLSVVIVPLMQTLWLRRPPSRPALLGAASAFAGLLFLTRPFESAVEVGDLWTLGCAFVTSLYIIELQRLAPRVDLARSLLGQFGLIALLCWAAALAMRTVPAPVAPPVWVLLVYLGVLCTFVTVLLHNRFQPETTPTRAALIFAAGPVLTLGISWLTLGETLSPLQTVGAGLILLGVLVTEIL